MYYHTLLIKQLQKKKRKLKNMISRLFNFFEPTFSFFFSDCRICHWPLVASTSASVDCLHQLLVFSVLRTLELLCLGLVCHWIIVFSRFVSQLLAQNLIYHVGFCLWSFSLLFIPSLFVFFFSAYLYNPADLSIRFSCSRTSPFVRLFSMPL